MPGKKQIAEKKTPQLDAAQQAKLEILRRVNCNDATGKDREAFRALLKQDADKWRPVANMIRHARQAFIEGTSSNGMLQEIAAHGCEELQTELAQPEDGALEKMLIDVAVFAWLRLAIIEEQYTSKFYAKDGIALAPGLWWEKRLNAAHTRFEQACLNLARGRKLLRPKVTNKLSISAINALVNGGGAPVPASVGAMLKGKDIFGLNHGDAS